MNNFLCKFALLLYVALSFALDARSSDRKAVWIAPETAQGQPNTWLIFRKDIKLDQVPDTLMADIAADTKYWMWLNGEMAVFEGGLKRGPEPNATYFDRVDIAPYLRPGDNTIAILVWHFGKNGFAHVNSGSAGLFFEAVSPEVTILSDNTWQSDVYDAPRPRTPTSASPRATSASMPARSAAAGICPATMASSPALSISPTPQTRPSASS